MRWGYSFRDAGSPMRHLHSCSETPAALPPRLFPGWAVDTRRGGQESSFSVRSKIAWCCSQASRRAVPVAPLPPPSGDGAGGAPPGAGNRHPAGPGKKWWWWRGSGAHYLWVGS